MYFLFIFTKVSISGQKQNKNFNIHFCSQNIVEWNRIETFYLKEKMSMQIDRFKIVLLGEGRVGKTSILLRYTKGKCSIFCIFMFVCFSNNAHLRKLILMFLNVVYMDQANIAIGKYLHCKQVTWINVYNYQVTKKLLVVIFFIDDDNNL